MSRILVEGKVCLKGTVRVQGSKNAALPVMAAALLHDGCSVLHNCPHIGDVFAMEDILKSLGARTHWEGHTLLIDSRHISRSCVSLEDTSRLRASVLLAGSLLGRGCSVKLGYPGGCAIGTRPVDLHIQVFCRMGVNARLTPRMVCLQAEKLQGIRHVFPKTSVGATENAILAAVGADGVTVLENAAREPEIEALIHFLQNMGAAICREKNGAIRIVGGQKLQDVEYVIPPDRIEAGTWVLASAITRGNIRLVNAPVEEMEALLCVYRKMGGQYLINSGTLVADSQQVHRELPLTETAVYPGFSTDLQPLLMAVCCTLDGDSGIRETVFENRFCTAGQLRRMGAEVRVERMTAYMHGPAYLRGTVTEATDLRAGAALVLAGMAAEGCTCITHSERIDRGYEDLAAKADLLGGRIRKEKD